MKKKVICIFLFSVISNLQVLSKASEVSDSNNYSFDWRQLKSENSFKSNSSFPNSKWWEEFQDPHLNEYIEKAIKNNPDYLIAKNKIDQARYTARKSLSKEFPVVEIRNDFTRQRNSENLTTFSSAQLQGSGPKILAPGKTVNIYNLPLSVNYELDPFFKKRLATKSRQALSASAEWQSKSILNTLTADVASNYFNLIGAEEQIVLLKQIIELDSDNIKLYDSLYSAGLIAEDELNTVKQQLEQNQEKLNLLKKNKEIFYNALAFLMGEAPANIREIQHSRLSNLKLSDILSTGIASELIFRRPDILAAEYDLKSAGINVSAAKRAYLPSLNLAFQSAFTSINLGNLVSPESLLIALTSNTIQTIFSAGERRANLNIAKSQKEEALNYYKKTIIKSFEEVENALNSYNKDLQDVETLKRQLNLQKDNLKIVEAKYDQGLIPYQNVILQKKKVIDLQQTLSKNESSLLISQVLVYKVLGGGQV
jgi:NodT family efflux transporter outer membrane factor (OMF) lipoprotein